MQQGDGRCRIQFIAIDTSNGISALITGGDLPHIGGVVLAVPRPSLGGEGISADVWISTVPGHKDTVIAEEIAKLLSSRLNTVVSISAGIHVDNARKNEFTIIRENCLKAAEEFQVQYRERKTTTT